MHKLCFSPPSRPKSIMNGQIWCFIIMGSQLSLKCNKFVKPVLHRIRHHREFSIVIFNSCFKDIASIFHNRYCQRSQTYCAHTQCLDQIVGRMGGKIQHSYMIKFESEMKLSALASSTFLQVRYVKCLSQLPSITKPCKLMVQPMKNELIKHQVKALNQLWTISP